MNGTVCGDADIAAGEREVNAGSNIGVDENLFYQTRSNCGKQKKGGPDNRPALKATAMWKLTTGSRSATVR